MNVKVFDLMSTFNESSFSNSAKYEQRLNKTGTMKNVGANVKDKLIGTQKDK